MTFTDGFGEAAAISTACFWAASSYIHGHISRVLGVPSLTMMRLPFQLAVLLIITLACGAFSPMTLNQLGLLAVSAFFGVCAGDLLLFAAMLLIGPHLGVLLQSLSGLITAAAGLVLLHEGLNLQAALGIALTSAGVALVVTEGRGVMLAGQEYPDRRKLIKGTLMGLVSAAFVAIGYLTFRLAVKDGLSPVWAGSVRIICAIGILWLGGLALKWPQNALRGFNARPDMWRLVIIGGGLSGLGMCTSALALAKTQAGVAAALIGLQPVMVMILGIFWYRRPPSRRAVVGTMVAFAGSALVCLR